MSAALAVLALVAGTTVGPVLPARSAEVATSAPTADAFLAFVKSIRPEALAQGIKPEVFDQALAGVSPDPGLAPLVRSQPEFAKPIGAYLAAQVTAGRVSAGQALLKRWRDVLAAVAKRSGVPAPIIVAVWGLETNYGTAAGSKDVIRSLATLAAMNYRPELYRAELIAALKLLQDGDVPRERLRGSWAGAMGQPQFMPSSFARSAVDGDGDGQRDIWGSVPDALASIANFLREQGWQAGEAWGYAVTLPPGLDPGRSRGSFAEWRARGVVRVGGGALPERDDGVLLFPAGAAGPAFLVTANFEVLKTYNFSDAYVLSIGELADRMAGRPPLKATWPAEPSMTRDKRIGLQSRLAELGYPVDNRQGRLSLAQRDVIRQAQARVGLVPDGNPTDALLARLNRPL